MRRLTVQVKDETHRALKMLTLMEDKPFGRVVVEAIESYLKQRGAYEFDIVTKADPCVALAALCTKAPASRGGGCEEWCNLCRCPLPPAWISQVLMTVT